MSPGQGRSSTLTGSKASVTAYVQLKERRGQKGREKGAIEASGRNHLALKTFVLPRRTFWKNRDTALSGTAASSHSSLALQVTSTTKKPICLTRKGLQLI